MAAQIEVRGLPALLRSLRAFGESVPRVTRDADYEVAQRVAADARARAPRRTGRLAGSITPRRGALGATAGTTLRYAPYVHFGSIHNPRPVPFLYDALDDAAPEAEGVYFNAVDGALSKVHGA